MKFRLVSGILLTAVLAMSLSSAQAELGRGDHLAAEHTAGTLTSTGVVRGVHKKDAKLMLSHPAIPAFDMSDMTMVFRVADPILLDGVERGDKIEFVLNRMEDGSYRIVGIRKEGV